MQPVEASHDHKASEGPAHQPWQVVNTATADAQDLRLLCDRKIMLTVDHRFALSNPALVSAPSKKSFSNVSSPIFACSDFTRPPEAWLRCCRDQKHRQPRPQAVPSTM